MKQALLVIDAQEIYTNPTLGLYCRDADLTLNNINKLIAFFDQTKQPVIYVQHMHKPDHSDLGHMFDFDGPTEQVDFIEGTQDVGFSKGLTLLDNPLVIRKNRYSSFQNTSLENMLRENNVERVVICGFMTNFCCESAARDAHDRDFYVTFVVDATGTPGVDQMDQDDVRTAVSHLLSAGFATVLETNHYLSL